MNEYPHGRGPRLVAEVVGFLNFFFVVVISVSTSWFLKDLWYLVEVFGFSDVFDDIAC